MNKDHLTTQAKRHAKLTLTLNISALSKAVILLAIVGIVLYTVLFSTYPAVHDFFHELRHSLMMIPCH
ncbi:MAG: CbtB-domain containing protein [Verrucomicrobiales bacterium]|nr:CbtB-domain containing protein [Verrucomicrobiales bacterium]